MSIRSILVGGTNGLEFEVRIYPACDYCGEEITKDTPANIEHEPEDGSLVYFLHKECSRKFRKENPQLLWSEFISLKIETK